MTPSPTTQPNPCVLCGSLERELVLSAPDFEYGSLPGEFRLVACCGCGHQFIDPLPSPSEVERLYSDTYYTVNPRSPLYFRGLVKRIKQQQEVNNTLRLVAPLQPRSILEVGCGNAQRLARLRGAWQPSPRVVGADLSISPELRRFATEQAVELVEANVDESLEVFDGESFDVIIMSQLIEHLRDPARALRRLRSILSEQGRLIIETPNRGGLDYELFKQRYWGGYHLPRHFHLFTRESLRRTIEEAGMHVVAAGCVPSPGLWIMSLRNRLGLSSVSRGRSPFEVLNFSNLLAVGTFSALDQARLKLGKETSNQFAVASRTATDVPGKHTDDSV